MGGTASVLCGTMRTHLLPQETAPGTVNLQTLQSERAECDKHPVRAQETNGPAIL